nr:PHB depolymerase family esterase [Bradyrhizobium zhengyangense]
MDGLRLPDFGASADSSSPLQEVTGFGDNPGALRMFAFVPAQLQKPRALVVVLHGCGQTAAAYDLGAGWSTLARHYGFALVMPEQQRINNGNTCFNWFNPDDTARDSGEARSIREMIAHMVGAHRVDPRRIYITGLSAGGGMTSVMLATYPEVFAAGAIIAGLPYGIASNLREALDGMFHSPERPERELGDFVRRASNHRGSWPKVSVWHGSADRTVNPGNANEIVKQWLDLHDLPMIPMAETVVDGYPRQAWWNRDGETLVESYAITGMAHGTPLGLADNDQRYGVEGAFLIEAGISSSYHIAKFFGLTGWIQEAKKDEAKPVAPAKAAPVRSPAPHLARTIRVKVAEEKAEPKREQASRFDLGQIITRALTAAGLMK